MIFRYFETKQKLIDAVYKGIGFTSWFMGWEAHLRDKSVSLSCRLKKYYRSYLQTMEDPNWIGITCRNGDGAIQPATNACVG